jgi:hypothetical protein
MDSIMSLVDNHFEIEWRFFCCAFYGKALYLLVSHLMGECRSRHYT